MKQSQTILCYEVSRRQSRYGGGEPWSGTPFQTLTSGAAKALLQNVPCTNLTKNGEYCCTHCTRRRSLAWGSSQSSHNESQAVKEILVLQVPLTGELLVKRNFSRPPLDTDREVSPWGTTHFGPDPFWSFQEFNRPAMPQNFLQRYTRLPMQQSWLKKQNCTLH